MNNDMLISFTDGKVIKLLAEDLCGYNLSFKDNTMINIVTMDGSMFIPWKNIRYVEIRRPEI